MIRVRILQIQKEFKSDIRVLIDPYTALWIEISDNSKIEPFQVNDQKNEGILIVSRNFNTHQISEIILIAAKNIEYCPEINNIKFNNQNIKLLEGNPIVKIKNRYFQKELLYNNFKIYYSKDSIKIQFLDIVNNYDSILKKIIKMADIYFETNKNGVLLSIILRNLPQKVIRNMLEVLDKTKIEKFLKLNKEETKSGYTIIDNPYPAPSK